MADFEDTQSDYHSFSCPECGSHNAHFEDVVGQELLTCADCGYCDLEDLL